MSLLDRKGLFNPRLYSIALNLERSGAYVLKSTVLITTVGIYALDSKGRIIDFRFKPDPEWAAQTILNIQRGQITDELNQIITDLNRKGYRRFAFEDSGLAEEVGLRFGLKTETSGVSRVVSRFKEDLCKSTVKLGLFRDVEACRDYAHNVAVLLAERAVTRETQKRDLHAIQIIRTIDDLDKTINLLSGRAREWYGLHFPELDRLLEKHETYLRLIADLGSRENMTVETLKSAGLPAEEAEIIAGKARESMGSPANPEDLALIQELCRETLELYRCRRRMEDYLKSLMAEVAPNITSILGPLLSARLISIAGSLERLAKMPASTVQVLGAEKALFRSLRTGTKPPKHGIIFQYQPLHSAPKWLRGKIARALSSKISIASRVDAFGGEFIGETLREDLERKIMDIRKKCRAPKQ
ncbi:C/D box methylation guide ribonucleoprotein complex aNOP56 subunit [Candidatus Bathyarchaeota archaeon]|nr:C/D box methylation guide ribonucleoprotein complex aNOP56 subunit [Candidatus Bathyarchaeota archaeon]